jgi:exodeoxyribonuclease V gamma subunit
MQAFSPAYFRQDATGDSRLFGYSPASAKISQSLAAQANRSAAESFLSLPLDGAGDEWKIVTLKNLQSFYRNPSCFFVQKRLEFRLPEDKDLLQEEEPFSVDGLEAYHCKQEILDAIFNKKSAAQLLAVWKGSGQLPPGPAAALLANDLFCDTGPVAKKSKL